jgi:hypothetical protein
MYRWSSAAKKKTSPGFSSSTGAPPRTRNSRLGLPSTGPAREGRFVWARAGKVSGWSSATQPILHGGRSGRIKRRRKRPRPRQVVGREGFEPPTSRLSSVRSDTELPARPSGNYLVPTGLAIHKYVTCNDLQTFFFLNSKNRRETAWRVRMTIKLLASPPVRRQLPLI